MKIAVFCSANDEIDPEYFRLTTQLGEWMAREGHTLVFGGCDSGLMECVARAVKDQGGRTIGVIPSIVEQGGLVGLVCGSVWIRILLFLGTERYAKCPIAGKGGTPFRNLCPLAVFFGLKRETIGAAHSIAREPNIALVGERYGLDTPEGRGVMGVYISGTVFGTIFFGLMASFCAALGIFHPYALAMASGVGSASMMSSAVGALAVMYPQMADQLAAFGAASNMLSGLDGLYMSIWLALPLTEYLYKKCCIVKYGHVLTKEEE